MSTPQTLAQLPTTFFGFDSAWTDNLKKPGAICAANFDGHSFTDFYSPELIGFAGALELIRARHVDDRLTLVAMDQPTIVPNASGMRPVERLVATLISWLGGGVQPSHSGKTGMFCAASPIWLFLNALNAIESPEESRAAVTGTHLIEVFPALALPSLNGEFFGRQKAPRYNPLQKKTFKPTDLERVRQTAVDEAEKVGLHGAVTWLSETCTTSIYRKEDQDRLDALLCLLIAIQWRLGPRETCAVLGNLETGYMVSPMSANVRAYVTKKMTEKAIPVSMLL